MKKIVLSILALIDLIISIIFFLKGAIILSKTISYHNTLLGYINNLSNGYINIFIGIFLFILFIILLGIRSKED